MRVVRGWEREKLSRRQTDTLFACLLSSRVRPMKKVKARPTPCPESMAGLLPTRYLRLSGSSVKPFPFKPGWKQQKLDKEGKDYSISRVKTLPPPWEHFQRQARGWVYSCPSSGPHLPLDQGVPLRHPISTLCHYML